MMPHYDVKCRFPRVKQVAEASWRQTETGLLSRMAGPVPRKSFESKDKTTTTPWGHRGYVST